MSKENFRIANSEMDLDIKKRYSRSVKKLKTKISKDGRGIKSTLSGRSF